MLLECIYLFQKNEIQKNLNCSFWNDKSLTCLNQASSNDKQSIKTMSNSFIEKEGFSREDQAQVSINAAKFYWVLVKR